MRRTNTPLRLARLAEALHRTGKERRREEMERLGVVQPEDHKLIPLLNGKFAKVDNEDFQYLDEFLWHSSNGYAVRKEGGCTIWMHRVITNCPDGYEVDHENRLRADNRRFNLRICDDVQNQGNRWKSKHATSSQYKGVYWCKRDQHFAAYGREGTKNKRLGTFQDERAAAIAYNNWASKYFGEFAYLNPV